MQVMDYSGQGFELSVVEYQSPDPDGEDWLVVVVRMKHGDVERVTRDPCLTVQEAHELADWLEEIAGTKGNIAPGMPNLIEPNLQIDILKVDRKDIELKVSFIFESRGNPPLFDHVFVRIGRNELLRAASDLKTELEKFPPR